MINKIFLLSIITALSSSAINAQASTQLCGLNGTIKERIQDCSKLSDSEKGGFVLVSRYAPRREIHMEKKTGLVWSERLPDGYIYHNAKLTCQKHHVEFAGLNNLNWRLPDIDEVMDAIESGMQQNLPNIKGLDYWTSTPHHFYVNSRFIFEGSTTYTTDRLGRYTFKHLEVEFATSVKCVATTTETFE